MPRLNVAVIGAGPAGMAAAIELDRLGVNDVMVFERNDRLGGILNQCIHTGFGLSYFKNELTGPEYAEKLRREFVARGIPHRLNSTVVDLTAERSFTVSSYEHGIERFRADAVILATGCRERTRENIEVAGTRPFGVFTAGQAQALVNLHDHQIGRKVAIQGSGDIGLIMARRFMIEGYDVVGVFERLPFLSGLIRNKVQCLDHFDIPIAFSSQIVSINGTERVDGIWVAGLDKEYREVPGSERYVDCDTVVFSVGLIQETELVKSAGAELIGSVAKVNSKFETSTSGVFVCGNSLHIHDLADTASREGEAVARCVQEFVDDPREFAQSCTAKPPYDDSAVGNAYTQEFFERLEADGATICTVCPRGCVVSSDNYPCARGEQYYSSVTDGPQLTLTTTVFADGRKVPVRSKNPVPMDWIRPLKAKLSSLATVRDPVFAVPWDEGKVTFLTEEAVS